jgi:uncharacterized DUF497 family protein
MLTWDETKRKLNIHNHGFDFAGCDAIWDFAAKGRKA